jgi:hypothetical protein
MGGELLGVVMMCIVQGLYLLAGLGFHIRCVLV